MPLRLPELPMSIAEYDSMPHRLGWKHEYWDGTAKLSPQETAIAEFRLPISTRITFNADRSITVRPVRRDDREAMIELFCKAFETSTEFAGSSQRDFKECAQVSVGQFFGAAGDEALIAHAAADQQPVRVTNSRLLSVSQVAEHAGQLVGAAMIRAVRLGPIIEPIFIDPTYLRQGIATALLAAVLVELQTLAAGSNPLIEFLYTRCHLGNPESLAWHAKLGFEELVSFPGTRHRWRHHLQQARHYRLTGNDEAARTAQAEADRFAAIADDLEQHTPPKIRGFLDR